VRWAKLELANAWSHVVKPKAIGGPVPLMPPREEPMPAAEPARSVA
jgi:hypothetical protein